MLVAHFSLNDLLSSCLPSFPPGRESYETNLPFFFSDCFSRLSLFAYILKALLGRLVFLLWSLKAICLSPLLLKSLVTTFFLAFPVVPPQSRPSLSFRPLVIMLSRLDFPPP